MKGVPMNKIKRIISATLVGIMIIPSAVSAFPIAPMVANDPIIQTVQLREAANNVEDGSFSPKTQFTRAQVAQILYNIDKNQYYLEFY